MSQTPKPRDDRGRAVPSSAPVRLTRRGRAFRWLAVAVAVCLVVAALTTYLTFRSVWDSIHRVEISGLGPPPPPKFTTASNILLIGSDSRAGPNEKFGAGIQGQRSDTIIILHIAPANQGIIALSIPRDSVVPVLACPAADGTAGQVAEPGQIEQINATFADGGPGCLWETIEQTTHLHLDHFIELNFTGFEHVIDDVGGVSVCLPFAVNDPLSRLRLSAGRHHIMGGEALAFWRARYIGDGSDLQRIYRDQYLMASVLQGVEHADLMSNPGRILSVLTDAARSMTTDAGLSLATLLSIVDSLRSLPVSAVRFIELPTVAYPANPNWVQWPPSDAGLFAALAHDLPVTRSPERAATGPEAGGTSRAAVTAGPRPAAEGAPSAVQSPGPAASPSPSASPGGLPGPAGGITGNANICGDGSAFAGPRGSS